VNGWRAFQLHQTKPVQLARVAKLGVAVPATLLANNADAVRDFAAKQGLNEAEALTKGMETKAVEFVKAGAEVYSKV